MTIRFLILAITIGPTAVAQVPIEEFVESFDGRGEFESKDGRYSGFDNPDWSILGNGQFRDGGFAVASDPFSADPGSNVDFARTLSGRASFVERIEMRDVYMRPVEAWLGGPSSGSEIALIHNLKVDPLRDNRLNLWVFAPDGLEVGKWILGTNVGGGVTFQAVPSGPHVALEIRYDDMLSQATFTFDNDLDDQIPALLFGPFDFDGEFSNDHSTYLVLQAAARSAVRANIDSWSLTWDPAEGLGDFNQNGVLDVADIDALTAQVRSGENNSMFDLNADELVNELDRTLWVERLRKTYFGDSNLDGEFNSRDLVAVFQAAQYDDLIDLNSGWASGDWNGDGDFNSRDLVLAFQTGGYETGPRVVVVPELSSMVLIVIAAAAARGGVKRKARGF